LKHLKAWSLFVLLLAFLAGVPCLGAWTLYTLTTSPVFGAVGAAFGLIVATSYLSQLWKL
jgi:membrane associated rhomboid family serine protease